MKHTYAWLLIAALLAVFTPSAVLAEEAGLTGSVEVGAAGMSVEDEVNKVNEYNATRDENGVNPYIKADFAGGDEDIHVGADAEVMGDDAQSVNLDVDAQRIFRMDASYEEFNHWLSHDQLDYMDATMKSQGQTFTPATGSQPGGNPDGSANPAVLAQDLVPNQDFFIIHKELILEGKVVVPSMPNVTLKAGFRQEERKGVEQEFSISHCSSCHIEGNAKDIDETTTDVSVGATGKFGMLTVDYEFMTRDFESENTDLTNDYLVGGKPDADLTAASKFLGDRLLFDEADGALPFSKTPDSEKDSHKLKARYDMSSDTVISAGYIKADIESSKQDDEGVLELSTNTLETEYDSYSMRASTRFDNLRLTGYGRREEIETSNNELTFFYGNGTEVPVTEERATYVSEEAREITTFGGNAVYRINSGTSVRLGYEFEEIDREIEELVDTETHTVKASVRYRPSSKLSTRASYKYQDIDDQFMHPHGNKGPVEEDFVYVKGVTNAWYEPAFYSLREAEATNLPEEVHELKASATWSPGMNYSVTAYTRYRMEENDLNFSTYEQDSLSPGFNVWWAPINNLNMTMAYNFNKMETENQMCVGWYHG